MTNIDWMKVGKEITAGVEHEFIEIFDNVEWEEVPCKTGFSQGYALKAMIQEFNLAATHVGEISTVGGLILAVKATFDQGAAEVFAFDEGHSLTMLAVRKLWEKKMNELFLIKNTFNLDEIERILNESTIFDKIEFSGITKEQIREEIHNLETHRVPNRNVLLDMSDEDLAECWFKNWLHPKLKHAVEPSPKSKLGCSKKVLENDMKRDFLNTYENGQQNFDYTLQDVKDWLEE